MIVVDASVVVAALADGGATGGWAESVLAGEPLAAPHVLPVEAASILHRAERAGEISADAASLAHADLGRLRVEYFPYAPFAERIWELCATPPGSHPPATPLQRVEFQLNQLQKESDRWDSQARRALHQGREDLARAALTSKASVRERLDDLRAQCARLRDQEAKTEAAPPGAAPQAGPVTLSCYDAWYVALAEFLGVRLATLNAGLARAPGPCCDFWLPPAESAPGP